MGDLGLIPGLGRSPGEGNSYALQYSGLENSMDYTVHGETGLGESWTWLSDFHQVLLTPFPLVFSTLEWHGYPLWLQSSFYFLFNPICISIRSLNSRVCALESNYQNANKKQESSWTNYPEWILWSIWVTFIPLPSIIIQVCFLNPQIISFLIREIILESYMIHLGAYCVTDTQ